MEEQEAQVSDYKKRSEREGSCDQFYPSFLREEKEAVQAEMIGRQGNVIRMTKVTQKWLQNCSTDSQFHKCEERKRYNKMGTDWQAIIRSPLTYIAFDTIRRKVGLSEWNWCMRADALPCHCKNLSTPCSSERSVKITIVNPSLSLFFYHS